MFVGLKTGALQLTFEKLGWKLGCSVTAVKFVIFHCGFSGAATKKLLKAGLMNCCLAWDWYWSERARLWKEASSWVLQSWEPPDMKAFTSLALGEYSSVSSRSLLSALAKIYSLRSWLSESTE